jgi:hypothetical protein
MKSDSMFAPPKQNVFREKQKIKFFEIMQQRIGKKC